MKAYVVNQDQLKHYIVIAIGALLLSFILGFIVGGVSDEPDKLPTVDAAAESSAVLDDADVTNKETKKDSIEEKADSKKNSPGDKKTTQVKPVEKPVQTPVAKVKEPPSKIEKPKEIKPAIVKPVVVKPAVEVKPVVASPQTKPVLPNTDIEENSSVEDQPTDVSSLPDDASLPSNESQSDKRVYSIQAGMFASKTNALSFIEKLGEENFDAYVTDFVSTSGAVKYNVRIGRFDERDQARARLQEFQKSFSSPAYVVISQ